MNHEIVKILTQKEYITTFVNKNLRLDRRQFTEQRQFNYQFGVLDSFSTSASCLLGETNKIIAVLKSVNSDSPDCPNFINFHVENLCDGLTNSKSHFSESNLLIFLNKLVQNNLEFEIPCPMKFTLHLTIINSDGNIYDCIAHLLSNLFSGHLTKENECALNRYIKTKAKTKSTTFCVIEDKLLLDPTHDEVAISSYYFSIIKFDEDDFIIHKIKGETVDWALIQEAISLS